MKPIVLITQNTPFRMNEILEPYFKVEIMDSKLNEENIRKYLNQNIFGLLTFVTDYVSREIIEMLPESVKVISNCAVGYNNIALEPCKAGNIAVTNTPGVLTDATADLAFALLLNIARRVQEGHKLILANKFSGWKPDLLLGSELTGKTLGIIGMGRIGQAVAHRARAFNLNVIYHNRKPRESKLDQDEGVSYKSMADLLTESDFISIHVSLGSESRHLLNSKEIALMKKSAYLINTSRGECINESAMTKALQEKNIAGAALDVFEFEPKITEALKKLENVLLTPHIGSATTETRQKMADIACCNIVNFYTGSGPVFRVN